MRKNRMERGFFISFLFRVLIPFIALAGLQSATAHQDDVRAQALVKAARAQVGVTYFYRGAYVRIPYPGGDVPMATGVCTDVVIRAYLRAFSHDLQKAVHEDMKKNFAAYPNNWGLKKPDTNIDHRRVPNLQTFFRRHLAQVAVSDRVADYLPGDIVTQRLAKNQPHIGIVSDRFSKDGKRRLLIHNIGWGAREEDALFEYPITGHFRYFPAGERAR